MPETALKCIDSWHRFMPDYDYKLWNEDNYDVEHMPYTKEAYMAGKYAFVTDVVRLEALKKEGGVYLDVDFEVFKSFDELLGYHAFAGIEGSKSNPVMMGVIASEPEGSWVKESLEYYQGRHFCVNGKMDLTTNVQFISTKMHEKGFSLDGREQDYLDLHVFPVEYFCPRLTTGEYRKTENTYCEHKGVKSSWAKGNFKTFLLRCLSPELRTKMILFKRKMIG